MVNGVDVLLEYLNKYKLCEENSENNKAVHKLIDGLINTINNRMYLTDFDVFEKLIKKYENVDIDNILNDVMLNVNRYNIYLMNKKIKFVSPVLDNDILSDDVKIDITDILNYLGVEEKDLDKHLVKDLKKFVNKDEFQKFASFIKASNGLERVLFDKIEDKNILVSILLHSNIDLVKNIINIFEKNDVNINKVVANIPSIFIKSMINDNSKFEVLCHYDTFLQNYELLNQYSINFKKVLKFPIFFLNDVDVNKKLIDKLIELDIKPANVLEYAGNVLVMKPEIVFNNIDTLKFHGVEFTDDDNNNGYTILGVGNLASRIDYLIEKELWENDK